MSKKTKQQFKQRLENNRGLTLKGEKKKEYIISSPVVDVRIKENIVAKVDRKNFFISQEEIKMLVNDIISQTNSLKKNQIIEVSRMCDVYYDLKFQGSRKINDMQELYFNVC